MNINDEDVRFALGTTRYNFLTRLNSSYSGAGVNAKSKVDMAFAAPDPLSELVWSPHDGLILKRAANSRLSDKKPALLWNVDHSSSQSKASKGDNNNTAVYGDAAFLVRPSRTFSTPVLCTRLESSAENDCSLVEKKNPIQNTGKGKEKAPDADEGSSNSEDDSSGSVESCNSAELYSRGIKRQSYDDNELILGTKRIKKQVLGSTTTAVRRDSSFKNWISNMVKGQSDSNYKDSPPLALPLAFARQENVKTGDSRTGFQTMFESLYCRNTNGSSDEESRELQIVVADKEASRSGSSSNHPPPPPPLNSSWITRLSSRTHMVEKRGDTTRVNDFFHIDPEASASKLSPEAMASVFARRLDALTKLSSYEKSSYHVGEEDHKLVSTPSKEILNAIRNLRLSRGDILRWMSSDVSLSNLNGLFVRLRLGKLEEGLGAASYYVACITGDDREHDRCRSSKSILVDVGGIKSSVGIQHVSKHDFLEDEIKTWWCTIVKNGCNVPSLDELNSKFREKKSLRV